MRTFVSLVFPLLCAQARAADPPVDFGTVAERHEMVPMRDGTKLSVYLYFPAGKGPWPVLLEQRYADLSAANTRKGFAKLAEGGYVVAAIDHHAVQSADYFSDGRPERPYRNRFVCIPERVRYRPPRTTLKPVVQGPQSAVEVGKKGEEIWTDKYGRVKVQFHWDRYGKRDEKSSCFVRVSQIWAGSGWGYWRSKTIRVSCRTSRWDAWRAPRR